jgi:PAS domain S-box-containing protein
MENRRQVQRELPAIGVSRETAFSPYADMAARRWERRRLTLALSVALGGIACSLLLGRALLGRERNYASAEFRVSVEKWSDILELGVRERLEAVNTTAAFFRGSDINDRRDFRTFVTAIEKRHPSIQTLAWAPRIPAAQRKAHEEAVRNDGFSKYEISQRDDQGRAAAAGQRDEYYPILFAEPSRQNQSLIALDLGSDTAFRAAILRAKANDHKPMVVFPSSVAGKTDRGLLYVVEASLYESTAGQKMKRPDDQPELDGFVVGVFRIETLVKTWLNLPAGVDVHISITPNGKGTTPVSVEVSPMEILGDVSQPADASAAPPFDGAQASSDFAAADARWMVTFVAKASYLAGYRTWKPVVALLTGLLTTALAIGFFWELTGRIASVQKLVSERWRDLRESDHYIRCLIDNMADAFFLCDEQGNILDVNKQACDSLGYRREELLSMTIADVAVAAGDSGHHAKCSAEEYPLTLQRVYRRKDGTTFPAEARLTLAGVGGQQLILATAHDVTNRKRAEQALDREQQLLGNALALYDGLAQQLTAVLDNFQKVGRGGDGDLDTAQKTFDEDVRLLREAMAETRRLIAGLRPSALGESGSLPPSTT